MSGLALVFSEAAIEGTGFKYIHKIKLFINIFLSTSMFNQSWAHPPATMVAKTASIVAGGRP